MWSSLVALTRMISLERQRKKPAWTRFERKEGDYLETVSKRTLSRSLE